MLKWVLPKIDKLTHPLSHIKRSKTKLKCLREFHKRFAYWNFTHPPENLNSDLSTQSLSFEMLYFHGNYILSPIFLQMNHNIYHYHSVETLRKSFSHPVIQKIYIRWTSKSRGKTPIINNKSYYHIVPFTGF